MADGEIDYQGYSVEQLVSVLKQMDAGRYPRDFANARRTLRQKWPDAPDDPAAITEDDLAQLRRGRAAVPDPARTFQVRYQSRSFMSGSSLPSNNLGLTGSGEVTVGPRTVTFACRRFGFIRSERTLELAQIANVEHDEAAGAVTIRTRDGKRFVTLWPVAGRAAAAGLVQLLPRQSTADFAARQAADREFAQRLVELAPRAPVTPTLIGLNVLVFVLMAAGGAGIFDSDPAVHVRFGSNFGMRTWAGEPWRLLSCAFIHFGIVHLAFNMYALFNGGLLTERLYGSARFLVIYLLAAVSGSVGSSLWDPTRNSAGASGAVFGVYGALLVFFALRRRDISMAVLTSAGHGALALIVYSLFIGATNASVDNAAHVGGLLGGCLAGLLLARPFSKEARAVARPGKVLAVAVTVCGALVLVTSPLWRQNGARGADLRVSALLFDFADDEERLAKRFQELVDSLAAANADGVRAAGLIEREVALPWHDAARGIREARPAEPADSRAARRLVALQKYVAAREEAMHATAGMLASPEPERQDRADQAWKRARQFLKDFEAVNAEPS